MRSTGTDDSCQQRQRDGENDAEENGELSCTVDLSWINQRVRHSLLEEGLTDNNVERRHHQGQDQSPNGVFQAQQITNDKVSRNQTAVEHHRVNTIQVSSPFSL